MLAAEAFCSQVEARTKNIPQNPEKKELHAKLGLCRIQLAYLQNFFDDDELKLAAPLVREGFRHLIIAILWVAFYSRNTIDFRLFRRVVLIEAVFSNLLVKNFDKFKEVDTLPAHSSKIPMAKPDAQTKPSRFASGLDAKTTGRARKLLVATFCILILDLILMLAAPKWKQYKIDRAHKTAAEQMAK